MTRISARQAALHRANEVLDAAWDSSKRSVRIALAQQALEISPLCADAYGLLAEEAEPGSDSELEMWKCAVDAGEMALGEEFFKECEGEFWGILETRPYMRARLGLALALWKRGEKDEAIGHLQEMLRLNPNDNQGNRYILAAYLVETGKDAEAVDLLGEYSEDESAFIVWTAALLAFRQHGNSAASRKALAKAVKNNKFVPAYLLGELKPPKRMPDYYGLGDKNEALFYAKDFGRGWEVTPGGLEWLSASYRAKPPAKRAGSTAKPNQP